MQIIMRLSALGLACLVASCGHVPLSTMVRLRNFDFATFDPEVLRVAVRGPDWLEPQPGGAKLSVSLWLKGQEGEKKTEIFTLADLTQPPDMESVAGIRRLGTRVYGYRVAEADASRVRALQAEGRELARANPGRNNLEMNVGVDSCSRGTAPAGPILTTTYLQPDAATGYLVLFENVDLRIAAREAGKNIDALLPTCGKSTARAPVAG